MPGWEKQTVANEESAARSAHIRKKVFRKGEGSVSQRMIAASQVRMLPSTMTCIAECMEHTRQKCSLKAGKRGYGPSMPDLTVALALLALLRVRLVGSPLQVRPKKEDEDRDQPPSER